MSPVAEVKKGTAISAVPLEARSALWCWLCGGKGYVFSPPAKVGEDLTEYTKTPCTECDGERAIFFDVRRLREVRPWAP